MVRARADRWVAVVSRAARLVWSRRSRRPRRSEARPGAPRRQRAGAAAGDPEPGPRRRRRDGRPGAGRRRTFPIQFQNDFLKAQGARVWVPLTLTIDPAKAAGGRADALPARDAARHDRAAAAGAGRRRERPERQQEDKDKKKDKNAAAAAPAAAPNYPFEDVGVPRRRSRRAGPAAAHPARHRRARRQLRSLSSCTARTSARPAATPKMSVLKQPLDVPNYATGELTTSTVILAERVDQLPAPITPDQQSERPYAFGQTEIIVVARPQVQEVAGADRPVPDLQPDDLAREEVQPRGDLHVLHGRTRAARSGSTAPSRRPFTPEIDGRRRSIRRRRTAASRPARGSRCRAFPEGNYRLEIKITDKQSSKVLTQNVNFTVTP